MFYVGLDLHSKQITVCILDDNGKVVERSQVRQLDQLQQRLARIPAPFEFGFEASCGYGAFVELLTPLAHRVVVAHPGHLKLIYRSRTKNDRNEWRPALAGDAEWMHGKSRDRLASDLTETSSWMLPLSMIDGQRYYAR
jgi:hypothetical protein